MLTPKSLSWMFVVAALTAGCAARPEQTTRTIAAVEMPLRAHSPSTAGLRHGTVARDETSGAEANPPLYEWWRSPGAEPNVAAAPAAVPISNPTYQAESWPSSNSLLIGGTAGPIAPRR